MMTCGSNSGSVYVFTRGQDGTWSQTQKLTASDGAAFDEFGFGVSVHGDVALIGAFGNDDLGTDSGSAYIFTRGQDGTWSQSQKLTRLRWRRGRILRLHDVRQR
jgi:hypothetical protein